MIQRCIGNVLAIEVDWLVSPSRPVAVAIGATISFELDITCTILSNTSIWHLKVYKTAIKRTCIAMV